VAFPKNELATTIASSNADDTRETAQQLLTAGVDNGEFEDDDVHKAFQFVNAANLRNISLKIGKSGTIPSTWILLDNQSTVDVFFSSELLENIRKGAGHMDIYCNAGVTSTDLIGDLPGCGTVWYHPKGIANILSLSRVKSRYRVTYDSLNRNEFSLHKPDDSVHIFRESERGLYFMDTAAKETALVTTVASKKSGYTNREYEQAQLACRVQKMIGHPSTKQYIKIVKTIFCPIALSRVETLTQPRTFLVQIWVP
jgi:hypothetical protein